MKVEIVMYISPIFLAKKSYFVGLFGVAKLYQNHKLEGVPRLVVTRTFLHLLSSIELVGAMFFRVPSKWELLILYLSKMQNFLGENINIYFPLKLSSLKGIPLISAKVTLRMDVIMC